ncbi:MAG TPA: rubrerythrin family protein [Spirochaetia bacterium]|nr:rubrerythrin family protein [Spirochaetia bacterium]
MGGVRRAAIQGREYGKGLDMRDLFHRIYFIIARFSFHEHQPFGGLNDTKTNLKKAMEGEDYETVSVDSDFAKAAEDEGEKEAATLFRQIAKVEAHHRDRYKQLMEMVERGTVWKREKQIKWKCSVCGYVHEGTEPPEKCPCCKHPKEYYEPANLDL